MKEKKKSKTDGPLGTYVCRILLDLMVVGVRGRRASAPEAVLAQSVAGAARAAVAEAGEGAAAAYAASQRVDDWK